MKLRFEPNLEHQRDAIAAVCDLFGGQEVCRTGLSVARSAIGDALVSGVASTLGVGNRLSLPDDELLKNLNAVQARNGLAPSATLASRDFTVEMETGTGKTYVYLRTIFELNRRYGFTKFVIVVPSIAIKEGVYKSLRITEDHFRSLYAGVPVEYFPYDSTRLGRVRSFATSARIQIMVVTVGAINKKDVNNLYKDTERTGGERPIDLIRATRPVVIVDEPQSVDGGLAGRGKEALDAMRPLCTLRYSATHVVEHHKVYRLDAVDAYERRLVKQIEIATAAVEGTHNRPYVRVVAVRSRRGRIRAKVELDVRTAMGVRRREVTVQDGDDLERRTGRAVYASCAIGEIRVARGDELVELRVPGGEQLLRPGEAWGGVDALAVERAMIRRTIEEHLDKEKRLRPQGIKVLSLFFVDQVARYRRYGADGQPIKGAYARIFEEEYRRLAGHPDHRALFAEVDPRCAAEEVHGGYFSVDRRSRRAVDTDERSQAGREAAERAYQLIMRDKEGLLSFATPLRFVFSHSALREGWDNPNVFQICTLRDIRSERERRQTVGRGLRLCVNQEGRRLAGRDVNTLTVVATESYQQFAEGLQKEIEDETGLRFAGRLEIGSADERRRVHPREAILHASEFAALWDRVNHRVTCRVRFDGEKLVESCSAALRDAPPIPETRLKWRKADLAIGRAGTEVTERRAAQTVVLDDADVELPDPLTELQDRTQLTRRTIHRVLAGSGRLDDFARNPQAFIRLAADAIDRCKRLAIAAGVKYQRRAGEDRHLQELFATEELSADLKSVLAATRTSLHEQAVGDARAGAPVPGGVARDARVEVYAKLPGWLTVPTPLGAYHPDWAVLVERDGSERLYLVVGTEAGPLLDVHGEGAEAERARVRPSGTPVADQP